MKISYFLNIYRILVFKAFRITPKTNLRLGLFSSILLSFLFGCGHGSHVKKQDPSENLTVGKAQAQIKVGMSGGAVAQILGSPNIVSTGEDGHEVWIYDKISRDVSRSSSQAGVWLILGGIGQSSSQWSSAEKTLTIVIKFDEQKKVKSLSYHSSKF